MYTAEPTATLNEQAPIEQRCVCFSTYFFRVSTTRSKFIDICVFLDSIQTNQYEHS